jgi:hypothetical protein
MADDFSDFEGDSNLVNPEHLIGEISETIVILEDQLGSLAALSPDELRPFELELKGMNEDLKEQRAKLKTLIYSNIIAPKKIEKREPEFPNAEIESTVLDIMNLAVTFYTQNPGLVVDPKGVYNLLMYSYSAPDECWNDRYLHKTSIIIGTPERLIQYFDNIIHKLNNHKAFDKKFKIDFSGVCTSCTPTQRILGYTREASINALEEFRKYCYTYFGIEG